MFSHDNFFNSELLKWDLIRFTSSSPKIITHYHKLIEYANCAADAEEDVKHTVFHWLRFGAYGRPWRVTHETVKYMAENFEVSGTINGFDTKASQELKRLQR